MDDLVCLIDIKAILDKHKITFWLDSGSLLGVVRDGKMIEWDDDIDIATLTHSISTKIETISKELYAKGYNVFVSNSKITMRKKDKHLSLYLYDIKKECGTEYITRDKVSKKDFFASVIQYVFFESLKTKHKDFIHNPNTKQKILLIGKQIVRKLPAKNQLANLFLSIGIKGNHFVFYHIDIRLSYVKKFKKVVFQDITINIPMNAKKYLETMYGKNWHIPNKNWDHVWDFYKLMKKQNTKSDLMSHLELVVNVLNKHKFNFWTYGGHLLGYIRDGELLSWEQDFDLFVWEKEYNKLLSLKKEFKKLGFKCQIKAKSMGLTWNDKEIGFQYYTLKNDKALIEDRLITKNKWGNIIYFGLLCKASEYNMKKIKRFLTWLLLKTNGCYIVTQFAPSHFFLNLKEIDFFGLKIKIPAETEKWFEHTFGTDWKTPKKVFQRPLGYYIYGGLQNSKYGKYYKNVPGWETKCIR